MARRHFRGWSELSAPFLLIGGLHVPATAPKRFDTFLASMQDENDLHVMMRALHHQCVAWTEDFR